VACLGPILTAFQRPYNQYQRRNGLAGGLQKRVRKRMLGDPNCVGASQLPRGKFPSRLVLCHGVFIGGGEPSRKVA